MKEKEGKNGMVEDKFWKEHLSLFTAQFPGYYNETKKVWGRFHESKEKYSGLSHEIIPIKEKEGKRTYVMMQPFVFEPKLTMTVGVYDRPKRCADMESPIGEVVDSKHEGFKQVQVGNAQAWYYPKDRMIVLWECFFEERFRSHPLVEDVNMHGLWMSFEKWLVKRFPKAETLATPFNDPIAESIEEYQTFLKKLGYSPVEKAAFGKKV